MWRISPDGILHHFAGTGPHASGPVEPPGDGGPAVLAKIPNAGELAAGLDGSIYITTHNAGYGHHSIRRVAPGGIISTIAGAGPRGSSGDGGPAAAALLHTPLDVEVAPDGSLYVASAHYSPLLGAPRVRKIEPAFPGTSAGSLSITSEDGRERYEFDPSGRHLRTYETVGNTILYAFGYDTEDRLVSIAERPESDGSGGKVTTIEHDAQGNPTAIVSPFGQRTELEVDGNGWLASITDAAGGEHQLDTRPDGLLIGYTDPNGASASYEYGAYGYLVKDTDRAGGWLELARDDASGVSEVTVTSRLGRTRSYRTERLQPGGEELRHLTDAAGLIATQLRDVNEVRTVTNPQGVVTVATPAPDWRFGMASPIPGKRSTNPMFRSALARATMLREEEIARWGTSDRAR